MNFLESVLSTEFIRAFAWTLLHSIWQGGLIALMAMGLLIILRKHKPAIRYMILYIFLLLIPVFFIATFISNYHPENEKDHSNIEAATISRPSEISVLPEMLTFTDTGSSDAWFVNTVDIFENHAGWLVSLWFIGFFIFLIRFSGSMLYVYRLKNYHVYPVEEYWDAKLSKFSDRLGLQKTVRLAESAIARIPMTIGYLKPVILLPIGTLSGIPPQQIDAILLHEMAHILRKDYLLNIIQSVIELLFFYHPVTWWLSGLIRQEREHICDDIVINVNQDHINYIKALTTMEEFNSKTPLLANALAGSKKNLLFRVKRMLTPVKLRKGFGEGIIAFILLVGLICTLSFNALSFIPSAYDLTGRESGERVYNFLPYQTSTSSETSVSAEMTRPEPEISIGSETPDTVTAKSKSGDVTISIYTDSTNQMTQEELDRIAESMDEHSGQYDKAMKNYRIEVEKYKEDKDRLEKQCKVVVIRASDSISLIGDSIVEVYSILRPPFPGDHFEFKAPQPGCPVPPIASEYRYLYSQPGFPERENIRAQVFAFKNDSIDTVIFIGPGEHMDLDKMKEFEWSDEKLNDRMKDIEMEIKREYRDADNEYHDVERDLRDIDRELPEGKMENLQFYFDQPPHPPIPPVREFAPEHQVSPSEEIIHQELWDDGLINQYRKYILEIDSKAMYLNGVKQPKEIYRKYKRLAEGLGNTSFDDDGIYRIIF